jgi:hypothetical protein
MALNMSNLPAGWRVAYIAALDLVGSSKPFDDPIDPAARARAQRARTNTRRWITIQKQLAAAGELTALQKFFIDQIADDWREIDMARRRGRRSEATEFRAIADR